MKLKICTRTTICTILALILVNRLVDVTYNLITSTIGPLSDSPPPLYGVKYQASSYA